MARILVVDDERITCNALKRVLTAQGHEVHTALNGASAVQKVKDVAPHIVLLDLLMPGMSGFAVLQEIKKVDPTVGVIMVTGMADEELAKTAVALGAYEYITKPIDMRYLELVLLVKIVDVLGTLPAPHTGRGAKNDRYVPERCPAPHA